MVGLALVYALGEYAKMNRSGDSKLITQKSYRDYRGDVLQSIWVPYVRKNEIKGWNRPYPELQFCVEDFCTAQFRNSNDKTEVREIVFAVCRKDGSNSNLLECKNKAEKHEAVISDKVVGKKEADEDFGKFVKEFLSPSQSAQTSGAGQSINSIDSFKSAQQREFEAAQLQKPLIVTMEEGTRQYDEMRRKHNEHREALRDKYKYAQEWVCRANIKSEPSSFVNCLVYDNNSAIAEVGAPAIGLRGNSFPQLYKGDLLIASGPVELIELGGIVMGNQPVKISYTAVIQVEKVRVVQAK